MARRALPKKPDPASKPLSSNNDKPYNCKDDEVLIAAYMGMKDTRELRHLILAWPFLKALPNLTSLWKGLHRKKLLNVVKRNGRAIQCTKDPGFAYAVDEYHDYKSSTMKRYSHAVWHLFQLQKDIEEYKGLSKEENAQRADEFLKNCLGIPKRKKLQHAPMSSLRHPKPNFGPYHGEIELECFNRYCEILKHLEGMLTDYARQWDKRYKTLSLINMKQAVNEDDCPPWMIESQNDEGEDGDYDDVISFPETDDAYKFINLPFEIQESTFEGAGEINAILKGAICSRREVPQDGIIRVDPQACPSGGVFRDVIRRQFGMPRLGIDFFEIVLFFSRQDDGGRRFPKHISVLYQEWDDVKSAFRDSSNIDFNLTIMFKVRDKLTPTFEIADRLPPWINKWVFLKT